jgi:hypothetical protein
VPEIEIYEFRVMRDQIRYLANAGYERVDGLAYPALIGPEVITRDNTRYSPAKPDDRDRMAIVYSVPFDGEDGELKGIVAAAMLTSAVRGLIAGHELALVNASTGFVTESPEVGLWTQASGGEIAAVELELIGIFNANGTVTTASFDFV